MDPRIHRRSEPEKGPGDLVSALTSQINFSQNINFSNNKKFIIHTNAYISKLKIIKNS